MHVNQNKNNKKFLNNGCKDVSNHCSSLYTEEISYSICSGVPDRVQGLSLVPGMLCVI